MHECCGRRMIAGIERLATDAKFSRLKDLPVDDTHANQWNIESTDGGNDRVGHVGRQSALIWRTAAFVAKNGK